jgi:hypothetical protein
MKNFCASGFEPCALACRHNHDGKRVRRVWFFAFDHERTILNRAKLLQKIGVRHFCPLKLHAFLLLKKWAVIMFQ